MPTLVLVHGGVSGADPEHRPGLQAAVAAGSAATSALDAVEAAVRVLEDDERLNAGWGASLNRDGRLELDAGIAEGATGRCGGVVCVTVAHPVSLARRVLEDTPHVLMAGEGAMALDPGMPRLTTTTPRQLERYRRAAQRGTLTPEHYGVPDRVDTVGAVALDGSGTLAAASSTGGVFGKLPGRVGDSAVFGAGTYASRGAAVVGTGIGELFLATLACARAGALIEEGVHPQEACERLLELLGARSSAPAGLLALDPSGRTGCAFRGASLPADGPEGPLEPRRMP